MDIFSIKRGTDKIYAIAAFTVALTVYLVTLCPTVYLGDSGEFITNAATLGINHPTGYTLYTLLARALTLIGAFWTAAYAVNFLSALSAALTVACLYYLCRLFTEQKELALAFSLAFAFSYTFWSRATIAEVYTLNTFFIALSLYLVLRWYFSERTRDLILLAYVVGLGLSQHVTGALVAPAIVLFIVLHRPRILFDLKIIVLLFIVAALGFSTYLYLPIRTAADPPIDWGNPENIQNIIGHFLPKSGESLFGETRTGGGFAGRISWVMTAFFTKEFWYVGALAAAGLFALGMKHWRIIVLLLGAMALNMYFTIIRKLPLHADFDAYFLPSFLIMGLLLCIAADWSWRTHINKLFRVPSARIRTLSALVIFALPILLLKVNYYENDKSNTWFGYDFGKNLLSTVPQNAVLFTVGDEQSFITWYFKYVEKEREDVTVVDRSLLGAIWGSSHMYNRELQLPINEKEIPVALAQQIISAMYGKRPIVFSPRIPWPFVEQQYDTKHAGMTLELVDKSSPTEEYTPTNFTLHPGWDKQFFDARGRLMVKFFFKEFIDNAKYWYSKGNKTAAQNELALFHAFPYRDKDIDDIQTAFLMDAQLNVENMEYDRALVLVDSAESYGVTDFRIHETRGNISYLQRDTAAALWHWRLALAYNPNNEKIKHNIDFLSMPRPETRQFNPNANRNRPSNRPFRRPSRRNQ